jgi:hypothetical protein
VDRREFRRTRVFSRGAALVERASRPGGVALNASESINWRRSDRARSPPDSRRQGAPGAPESRRALTRHPLHSGAIRIGLYCLHAKFPRTSTALDVRVRYSHVGIEPLASLANRHSGALALAGIVCDVERRHSTCDGIFSVLAGAYDHQPAQTGERNQTRDIRRLCLDTQPHVPRTVGSTLGLGHQSRHADPTCAGAAIYSAHTVRANPSGGACPASAIRRGLCSILPACKPLVGA